MSRILLIPVAVIFAAGGVVLGPGESDPRSPAQPSIAPSWTWRSGHEPLNVPYAHGMDDVLVVEDEEDIAFPLVRTLEREGYDVGPRRERR